MSALSKTETVENRTPLTRQGARIDPFYYVTLAAALSCIGLLLWMAGQVVWVAWPAISLYGLSLIGNSDWNTDEPSYGLLPFIIGSCVTAFVALGIALPLGVFIAIFLSEDFVPRQVRNVVRFVVELLAAIPSVVYGLWGLTVIVPIIKVLVNFATVYHLDNYWLFSDPSPTGLSLLTAALVLSLMILPTITAISRNALESVPHVLREGAYALGATRWETVLGVLLPSAAPGVVAAAILALGRALGETMAVAMLIGGSSRLDFSVLNASDTLASLLAGKFLEADEDTTQVLMYAALVLMLTTLLVNLVGAYVLRVAQAKVKGLI